MKVEIRSIKMYSKWADGKTTDYPNQREVATKVVDQYHTDANFVLPSIEVDGLIVVGGIYELIFSRREA